MERAVVGAALQMQPGVLLLDRYRLEAHLATGGMGEVWRGTDLRLGGTVAIKCLTRSTPAARQRFQGEAEIAARLPGPNIVRVFDFGEFEGMPFLVMELLHGETLRQRLRIEGKLTVDMTQRVIGQVVAGLRQAHDAGVIHRDIKPENIFLSGSGENVVVKLLDFGVAKSDQGHQTRTGDLVGTPHYASPEQLADSSRLGPATDLWSLAAVTFECLTGERPFRGESLARTLAAIAAGKPTSRLMESLPEGLKQWFASSLAPEPDQRPADAEAFALGLSRALAGGKTRDDVHTTLHSSASGVRVHMTPSSHWSRRLRVLSAAAVVLGALGLAAMHAFSPTSPNVREHTLAAEAVDVPRPAPAPGAILTDAAPQKRSPTVEQPAVEPVAPTVAAEGRPVSAAPTASARPVTAPSAHTERPKQQRLKALAGSEEEELLWSRRK